LIDHVTRFKYSQLDENIDLSRAYLIVFCGFEYKATAGNTPMKNTSYILL